ncbi:MAG: calcium-binding protein [Maritimibacter sp.]
MQFSVRGTVNTGQDALDFAISDLVLLQDGSDISVFATSGANGGLSSYTLVESGIASLSDSALYNPGWATGISDKIALLDDGYGGARLVFGRVIATGLGSASVSADGSIAAFETLGGLSAASEQPEAFAGMGSDHILFGTGSDGFASYTLTGVSLSGDFTLSDSPDRLLATISAIATVETDTSQIIITASGSEDGISSFRYAGSETVLVDQSGPDQGVGLMHPTAMATASFGNRDYVLVASAQDEGGAISVFEIADDGTLSVTDHVLDTRDTRFGNVQDIAIATHGDFTYVIVGGGDDGLSLFQLLPDGSLQIIDTIMDDLSIGLTDVSAIAAGVIGNTLRVLVGSQSEGLLTDLAVDLSGQGVLDQANIVGENITGSALDDTLVGNISADQLSGGNGDDILVDGGGVDQLTGGSGADTFVLHDDGVDDAILDFDPLRDLLDLSNWPMLHDPASLTVVSTQTGATVTWRDEILHITSVDHTALSADDVIAAVLPGVNRPMDLSDIVFPDDGTYDMTGTDGNDVLRGGPEDETIFPGQGDDTVWAGPGDDTVLGGAGSNTIYLEAGDDTYLDQDASTAGDGDTIYGNGGNDTIATGIGDDTVFGGPGDDEIYTSDGDDIAYGKRGQDHIEGMDGNDTIYGGAGRDLIEGGDGDDVIEGNRGRDQISAGAGNDEVLGGRGRDFIYGGSGNDTLSGDNGYDRIFGDTGDDILRGNAGNDWLWGDGADSFVFAPGDGRDRIYDFQPDRDSIHLVGIGHDQLRLTQLPKGCLLSWDDGSVILIGFSTDDLTLDDIHFI